MTNIWTEENKQNKTKQSKTKQTKTKQNKTKQSKTKQNKTDLQFFHENNYSLRRHYREKECASGGVNAGRESP